MVQVSGLVSPEMLVEIEADAIVADEENDPAKIALNRDQLLVGPTGRQPL